MTAFALERRVFAGKFKSRLREMVEARSIELRDLELAAVVFCVAAGAIQLALRRFVIARMIAEVARYAARNLRVAVQTFERPFPKTEGMTVGAFDCAFQILVRPR